jgi:hypothetical protein
LIAATSAALLLLKSSATPGCHSSHCHGAGHAANEGLHIVGANHALPSIANREALSRIGHPHAGKAALSRHAATANSALQAVYADAGRPIAKHAA